MSLSDLASIGSLASGVAVLVSLIYLSHQVRQTTKNQRALLQQGRAARSAQILLSIATDEELTDIHRRGSNGDESISAIEQSRFLLIFQALVFGFEDTYFQHREKLLDEAAFQSTDSAMRAAFRLPGYRAGWKMTRNMREPSFREFVDRMLADVAVAQGDDRLALWRAAIAEEKAAALRGS
jgi:hypothetical protein